MSHAMNSFSATQGKDGRLWLGWFKAPPGPSFKAPLHDAEAELYPTKLSANPLGHWDLYGTLQQSIIHIFLGSKRR